MRPEPSTLARLRQALLWTMVIGLLGTGAELLLLGHIEGFQQLIPLVLIAAAIAAGLWHAILPSAASVKAVRAAAGLCILSGGLGVALHYRGNLEFELEMYPAMVGRELITKVMTGATPVLAPGTVSLLGIVGLMHTYRHPAASGHATLQEERS